MHLRHTLPLALLLGACSSAPKPAMPDGGQRVPANTQDRIDAYLDHTRQTGLASRAETSKAQRIATLENQLREATQLLASWAKTDDAPTIAAALPLASASADDGWIELRPGIVGFHFSLPLSSADFRPAGELHARLLSAAQACARVTIRASTGANLPTPARRRLTERLAAQVRDHLILHGVPADIIGIDLTAAPAGATGGHPARTGYPAAAMFLDIETAGAARPTRAPEIPTGEAK
ncbi:hypothetical protein HUX88_03315 [Duganella sp. BJB1802]|uniref:hypothetical protein n=1 Tax=Duganella sp. BJB1802 TaxID=2744575 RepID=UPI001594D899|nr:hypothetical protein [Duganella sp. BJB1802]NVD69586.1 hypothetical protein [Duganella sp. BJB1802]